MSSKSRNKSTPHSGAASAVPGRRTPAEGTASAAHADEHGLLGEEVIHVPKGRNRTQYAVMVALMVFLTIIFLVPGAILQTFLGPGRGDPEFLAFTDPAGEPVVMRESEFYTELRTFSDVLDIPDQAFIYLRLLLGLQGRGLEHEEAARLIVLDKLASDAGIVISNEDLAGFLSSIQGMSPDLWRAVTARSGGPAKVEVGLKRVLAIRRYLDLMSQVARVPDVDAIEKRWAEDHVEIAYDYVQIANEDMLEAAKAEAPDDEGLEAWWNERSEFERSRLNSPARYRASIAVLRDPAMAAGLVERYPDTSGETPEARAESYYNAVYFTRFQRPAPPETPEGEEPAAQQSPFLPLDEVRDVCVAEAPGYYAAKAWIADLRSRANAGGEVDFRGEIAELGLDLIGIDEPSSVEKIREREGLGAFVTGPFTATPPGQVAVSPVVEPAGLFVMFVDEKLDPAVPPYAEIRDQVFDTWAAEHAKKLAVDRLGALRDGFETFEPPVEDAPEGGEDEPPKEEAPDEEKAEHRRADEAAFRTAAEAAGFEVKLRDWLDKSAPPTADPKASEPAHQFLAQHREYADLADGEVPEPALGRTGTHAYLARKVGQRTMDLAKMTPQVYESYKSSSAFEAATQVRIYLTGAGLDEQYGIRLLVQRDAAAEDDAPPDGEPTEDPAK
jgi:hypothetical protein